MNAPQRHWRSYGTEPLPLPSDALDMPLRAFPSWFLRITCDRCGKATMLNEAHTGERRGGAGRSCSPVSMACHPDRCGRLY